MIKMDEEEDFIVKEVPVYLSKQLIDQLYIYQYPLRPPQSKLDTKTNIKSCAIKPNNQEVKLEIGLNINSANFDMSKAEEIAINADGAPGWREKENGVMFENNIMDRQTLSSCKSVEDCSKYAIGVVHGNEIHITPVKGILQLRPTFPYLDQSDKRIKEAEKAEVEEETTEPEAKQITVKFARTENEKMRKAREKSFNYLCQKSAEEPWCNTKWHHSNSDAAELERMKLLSEGQEYVGEALNVPSKQYLRLLVPQDKEEAAVIPQLPAHVISLNALKQLPLLEQCRLLLKDAKIITFQQLMILLSGGESINMETVLRTLPQVASLCRGNWVVRSDVLYPKDTFSSISGVPANIMCRARDYVLYLFTQKQYVDRRKVSSVIKLPTEEVKEIFTGISRLRTNRGWELLLPTDSSFIDKYPDVVQRQQLFWEAKQKQFNDLIRDCKTPQRQRRKSKSVSDEVVKQNGVKRDSSIGSDNDSGTEKSKKSPICAKKLKYNNNRNNNENINNTTKTGALEA